jgi:putative Ca2+/H+ antiporter (TMEM165/GDT1 family)
VGDSQFTEGFVSGLLLIFFSEIGDKTFFIALLLALKQV